LNNGYEAGIVTIAGKIAEYDVDIEIFDINGTRVLNGKETGKQAGIYNYKWNASAHASGVYFVRITAKGTNGLYTFTSKLMLLK